MAPAASISPPELTFLIQHMPQYQTYRSRHDAVASEQRFRQALGRLLKDCGDHLLTVAERHPQILGNDQLMTIENLVDSIGAIFRRLDRDGQVTLVETAGTTIAELEELDTRLILLVEEALRLTRLLAEDIPASAWFMRQAPHLLKDLTEFSRTTEERNFLLGLGWESEFTWPRRS
jgi:hypothetical protein